MHETIINVRWGELDPYQHVNHASYLSYLEHARIAALESIGWGMDAIASRGCQVVVVRADVRFRRPARGGDRLTVLTRIDELRSASSTWHQEIQRDGEVLVTAEITAACTTMAGRPTRTPAEFQGALEELAAHNV